MQYCLSSFTNTVFLTPRMKSPDIGKYSYMLLIRCFCFLSGVVHLYWLQQQVASYFCLNIFIHSKIVPGSLILSILLFSATISSALFFESIEFLEGTSLRSGIESLSQQLFLNSVIVIVSTPSAKDDISINKNALYFTSKFENYLERGSKSV